MNAAEARTQAGSGEGAYAVRAVRMPDTLWAEAQAEAGRTGEPIAALVRDALESLLEARAEARQRNDTA